MSGQAISNLDADRVITRKAAKDSAPIPAYPVRMAIAQVISGSPSIGYIVTVLNSRAELTSKTFYAVGTLPGGQTLSAGTQVALIFRGDSNDAPFIFTGGGSGSGTDVVFSGYMGYFSDGS